MRKGTTYVHGFLEFGKVIRYGRESGKRDLYLILLYLSDRNRVSFRWAIASVSIIEVREPRAGS